MRIVFKHMPLSIHAKAPAAHAAAEACDGTVINIACNAATTINRIVALLKELMNTDVEAEHTDTRPGDVRHSLADVSLAERTIGYVPKVFFEEGLRKAIDWYTANL